MKRALVCLALLMPACGHSDPTRFYTLAPVVGAGAATYSGPPVRLEAVHLPPAVAGHRIMHGTSDHEVSVSVLERWTDDLDYLMRQTLAQDLRTRLPSGALIFPDAPRPGGSLSWVVDVLTLREVDGEMTCELTWSLMTADAPQVVQRRQGAYTAKADGSGAGTADALSRIVARLADAMVASLPDAAAALATRSPSASVSPAP